MYSMLPADGVRSRMTCAELSFSVSRIMTPAFAAPCVGSMWVTRATIWPSPVSCCQTNWKESCEPQMSDPAPVTVNTPLFCDALPDSPTGPMS